MAPDSTPDTTAEDQTWTPLHQARLTVAGFLALAISDPRSERWARLDDEEVRRGAVEAAALLAQHPGAVPTDMAPGERPPGELDLTSLVDGLSAPHDELVAEFDRVFGLVSSKECPPYETEYCPQTFSVFRSQEMADVAGYYAAFGLQPSRDVPERPDHVALEIEFVAWLLVKECHAQRPDNPHAAEQVEVSRDAQKSFVETHLAWWLPAFAAALQRKVGEPEAESEDSYLGALADALAAWVPIERAVLGVDPPTELAAPSPSEEDSADCDACGAGAPEDARTGPPR